MGKQNIRVACYCRVGNAEQINDRCEHQKLNEYADNNGYIISQMICEHRSGIKPYSDILKRILQDTHTRHILVPTVSSLSRSIDTQLEIMKQAKYHNKKIISTDGKYENFQRQFPYTE